MEQKTHRPRKPVKTVARLSARERRCSQNGNITTPVDGSIRIDASTLSERPEAQSEAQSKGCVEVVEAYFDAAGKPMKRKGLDAARVARAYDAQGNQVEEAYFNAEGKPTVRKDVGAARISWRYDDSGNRIGAAFYGADGSPVRGRTPGRKGVFEGA